MPFCFFCACFNQHILLRAPFFAPLHETSDGMTCDDPMWSALRFGSVHVGDTLRGEERGFSFGDWRCDFGCDGVRPSVTKWRWLLKSEFFESIFSICHLCLLALHSGLASLVFGLGDGCGRNGCTHGPGTSVSLCLGWELLAYGQLDRRKSALLLRACKDWNCLALSVTSRPQFLKQVKQVDNVDPVDHLKQGYIGRVHSMLPKCSEESQPQVIQVSFSQWPCWLAMSPLTC